MLDISASDLKDMSKNDKLKSIKIAEGRTISSEVITVAPPLLTDISNVELASSFGADIILLNVYNVNEPEIKGIHHKGNSNPIKEAKRLTGRMIGVNLEPVDQVVEVVGEKSIVSEGRLATLENIEKIIHQGADLVVFTGNPQTGVTNESIINSIRQCSEKFGDEIIIVAGKMHAAGAIDEVGKNIINKDIIKEFIHAGCDIILLPAPGTVPGINPEHINQLVEYTHSLGKMVMTTIGTSQEGADKQTIRNIALYSKMAGADIHHLGDAGMTVGMATPENIMAYSIAIRGKRHTYRRMARSVNR